MGWNDVDVDDVCAAAAAAAAAEQTDVAAVERVAHVDAAALTGAPGGHHAALGAHHAAGQRRAHDGALRRRIGKCLSAQSAQSHPRSCYAHGHAHCCSSRRRRRRRHRHRCRHADASDADGAQEQPEQQTLLGRSLARSFTHRYLKGIFRNCLKYFI